MSVESGHYIASSGDRWFNRHVVEDMSLLPKQVYFSEKHGPPPRPIILEQKPGGTYNVKFGGSPAGVYNDRLVAFLIGEEQASEFEIRPSGDGYIFSTRGRNVIQSDEEGYGGFLAKVSGQGNPAIIKLEKVG